MQNLWARIPASRQVFLPHLSGHLPVGQDLVHLHNRPHLPMWVKLSAKFHFSFFFLQGASVWRRFCLQHDTILFLFGTRTTLQVGWTLELYNECLLTSVISGHGSMLTYKCSAGGLHNRLTSDFNLDTYNLTCLPENRFSIPTWPTCAASITQV